jgi:hypothetical protein
MMLRHRHIISVATTAFATLAPLFAGFRRRLDFHWLLTLIADFHAAFSFAASSMPSLMPLRTIITLPFHAAFDVGFIFQFSLLIFSPSFFRYAMIAAACLLPLIDAFFAPFSLMLLFAIIFADFFATIFDIIFRLLTSR